MIYRGVFLNQRGEEKEKSLHFAPVVFLNFIESLSYV